jgi:hypothetical protein
MPAASQCSGCPGKRLMLVLKRLGLALLMSAIVLASAGVGRLQYTCSAEQVAVFNQVLPRSYCASNSACTVPYQLACPIPTSFAVDVSIAHCKSLNVLFSLVPH